MFVMTYSILTYGSNPCVQEALALMYSMCAYAHLKCLRTVPYTCGDTVFDFIYFY